MKHQVILIGGQVLPLYIGVIQKNPDQIFALFTEQSEETKSQLQKQVPSDNFTALKVNAYDFNEVYTICKKLIENDNSQSWELNLTGGTKIMALAAQKAFHESNKSIFYVDQNHKLFNIDNGITENINCKINTEDFFKLADQCNFKHLSITDFSPNDFHLASQIEYLSNSNSEFTNLLKSFRSQHSQNVPANFTITSQKGSSIKWNKGSNNMVIDLKDKKPYNQSITNKNAVYLVLNGGWFEILAAKEISKWQDIHELWLNVEFSYKNEATPKNEIDILINTGNNLIFVECKSGIINATDINKMKVVRELYGGITAKSLLFCRNYPASRILEKCKEFDIEIFALNGPLNSKNNYSDVQKHLNLLQNAIYS